MAFALIGCTRFETISTRPEVPEEVRWVYAAVASEDGHLEMSAIEPWPGARFELNGGEGLVRSLVGYARSTPELEAAVHQPLRGADLCEAALPLGQWCATIDDAGALSACDAKAAHPVTFDGLERFRRCSDALAVRLTCGGNEVDCAWQLLGEDCSYQVSTCSLLPTFSFAFDGIARSCSVQVPNGCRLITSEGSLFGVECSISDGACTAELYVRPEAGKLEVAERIMLLEAEPRWPASVTNGSQANITALAAGYAYDFAVAGDRLHVAMATQNGVLGWVESFRVAGPEVGTILRVIEPDGRVVAESTPFPEPTIAIEAVGGELVAVMGVPPVRLWIRRFDQQARLLSERRLEPLLGPSGARRGAALATDGTRLFLSIQSLGPTLDSAESALFELDPTTLSTVAAALFPSQRGAPDLRAIASIGLFGSRILVEDGKNDSHLWLDVDSLEKIAEVPNHGTGESLVPYVADGLGIAAVVGSVTPGLDIVDLRRTDSIRVVRFEYPGSPTALGPWPGAPTWASAATMHEFVAYVGPVDLANARVLLGATAVGFGVATRLRADGPSLWALLPWAGQVVRLTTK